MGRDGLAEDTGYFAAETDDADEFPHGIHSRRVADDFRGSYLCRAAVYRHGAAERAGPAVAGKGVVYVDFLCREFPAHEGRKRGFAEAGRRV